MFGAQIARRARMARMGILDLQGTIAYSGFMERTITPLQLHRGAGD